MGSTDNINEIRFEDNRRNINVQGGEERQFYDFNPFSLNTRPLYTIPEEVSICIDDEELASENRSYLSNMSNATTCDDLVGLCIDANDDSWNEERSLTKSSIEQCTPDNWGQFVTDDDSIVEEFLSNKVCNNYGLMKRCSTKHCSQRNIS